MQPTAQEMQAMTAAGQNSLDDLRAAVSVGGAHDEFLDHMLGCLPPSAWPDLSGAAGGQAQRMQQQQFEGLCDENAQLASRLRQHQVSGGPAGGSGAEAAAAKQMAMQQLADLRQGHHMMLQGMGRSTAGGGGEDGGMLLPLSLGSGGLGGDMQALLKAAANSTVLIRRSRRRVRRQLRRIAPTAAAAATTTFPASDAAHGADAEPGLRWRRRQRSVAEAAGRWRAGAAPAARASAARPGHRPPQHRGAATKREDRGEDEGAARGGAQRQQDGQGVDAGRDHRLRQVPAAPGQGAEHEPVGWRRCRRAARGRHVLRGAGQRRGLSGERQRPGGDGAAGRQADGGGHGHRHAVPAGEGPLPHARLPRLRHFLRDVPHAPAARRDGRGGSAPGGARRHCGAPHGRRHASARHQRWWRQRHRSAGLAEHVSAHGSVRHGQRRRRQGQAAQGRRLRIQAMMPLRPSSAVVWQRRNPAINIRGAGSHSSGLPGTNRGLPYLGPRAHLHCSSSSSPRAPLFRSF